jgi:hypothetical protein
MFRKTFLPNLIFAVLMLITAFGLKYAAAHHLVSGDMPMRGVQVLTGLMLAYYGNVIPKTLPRFREGENARIQSLRRTVGWLSTLSGLGYAAVWAAVPLASAAVWSVIIVGATTLLMIGCIVWTHFACRREAKVPH